MQRPRTSMKLHAIFFFIALVIRCLTKKQTSKKFNFFNAKKYIKTILLASGLLQIVNFLEEIPRVDRKLRKTLSKCDRDVLKIETTLLLPVIQWWCRSLLASSNWTGDYVNEISETIINMRQLLCSTERYSKLRCTCEQVSQLTSGRPASHSTNRCSRCSGFLTRFCRHILGDYLTGYCFGTKFAGSCFSTHL